MTTWRKSSASGAAGECVEVKLDLDRIHVLVRDSKDPGGTVLRVPVQAWRLFLISIKNRRGNGWVQLRSHCGTCDSWNMWQVSDPDTHLRFTQKELLVFRDGVDRGEFEVERLMGRGA